MRSRALERPFGLRALVHFLVPVCCKKLVKIFLETSSTWVRARHRYHATLFRVSESVQTFSGPQKAGLQAMLNERNC